MDGIREVNKQTIHQDPAIGADTKTPEKAQVIVV